MSRSEVNVASDDLEQQTLAAVQSVVHQLDRALDAVIYGDRRLADEVAAAASPRQSGCQQVRNAVLSALSRHPNPRELQMIAALLQIVHGAERISGQSVRIALIVSQVPHGQPAPIFSDLVDPAARLAVSAVWLAKQSFAARDVDLAHEAFRADAELKRRSREIYRAALGAGEETASVSSMAAFLAASYLERVGDIAVDLAEQTVIVVNGLFQEIADSAAAPRMPSTV